MRSFRFSIARLLQLVVVLGLSFAALRRPSPLWANAWFSASLAILTIAVLGAICRRGLARAFWLGFATCGWVYLVLALGPWLEAMVSPFLITTAFLDIAYAHTLPPPPTAVVTPMGPMAVGVPVVAPEPAGFSEGPVPLPGPSPEPPPGGVPALPPAEGGDGSVPSYNERAPSVGVPGMPAAGMGPGMTPGSVMYGGMGGGVAPAVTWSPWSAWTDPDPTGTGAVNLISPEPFRRIGHSVFALLLAVVGGAVARHFTAQSGNDGRRE